MSGEAANIYSIAFDVCGIPGVFLTGWISDRYFRSRRAGVALMMMLGMTVSAVLLLAFAGASVAVFVVLLGAVGFSSTAPTRCCPVRARWTSATGEPRRSRPP